MNEHDDWFNTVAITVLLVCLLALMVVPYAVVYYGSDQVRERITLQLHTNALLRTYGSKPWTPRYDPQPKFVWIDNPDGSSKCVDRTTSETIMTLWDARTEWVESVNPTPVPPAVFNFSLITILPEAP